MVKLAVDMPFQICLVSVLTLGVFVNLTSTVVEENSVPWIA